MALCVQAEEQNAVCDRETAEFEKAERQEEAHKEAEVAAQRQQLELVTQQTQGLRAQCQASPSGSFSKMCTVDVSAKCELQLRPALKHVTP